MSGTGPRCECSACKRLLPRGEFSPSQLKNPAARRRCKGCVAGKEQANPHHGVELTPATQGEPAAGKKTGRPPKASGERLVRAKTWSCEVRCELDALRAAAEGCILIKKLAVKRADGLVKAFVALSADQSMPQLAAALIAAWPAASTPPDAASAIAAAAWTHRAGSEWSGIVADSAWEVVLPRELARPAARRGLPAGLYVQPGWIEEHLPEVAGQLEIGDVQLSDRSCQI